MSFDLLITFPSRCDLDFQQLQSLKESTDKLGYIAHNYRMFYFKLSSVVEKADENKIKK